MYCILGNGWFEKVTKSGYIVLSMLTIYEIDACELLKWSRRSTEIKRLLSLPSIIEWQNIIHWRAWHFLFEKERKTCHMDVIRVDPQVLYILKIKGGRKCSAVIGRRRDVWAILNRFNALTHGQVIRVNLGVDFVERSFCVSRRRSSLLSNSWLHALSSHIMALKFGRVRELKGRVSSVAKLSAANPFLCTYIHALTGCQLLLSLLSTYTLPNTTGWAIFATAYCILLYFWPHPRVPRSAFWRKRPIYFGERCQRVDRLFNWGYHSFADLRNG